MTYRDFIDERKAMFVGKTVLFDGKKYVVVDVDYNAMLLIDKPTQYTDTTAVSVLDVIVLG